MMVWSAYYNDKIAEFIYINEYSDMSSEECEEVYETCIGLPSKYYIDEHEMMEEFIETVEDVKIYNNLQLSISGKGTFRRFKDTCNRYYRKKLVFISR